MEAAPQIVRIWKGTTSAKDAPAYAEYLLSTGLPGYTATPGNRAAYFTRRDVGDTAEFCLITVWDSMESIRAFAGDDPSRAVFYPQDERYLLERDLTVAHYEVFASAG